jgi:hypothetical protein
VSKNLRLWQEASRENSAPLAPAHTDADIEAALAPPKFRKLPVWPSRTVALFSTMDEAPHAIPVTAPFRVDDRWVLFTLKRDRGSLARLRTHPQVALTILAQGDLAFTARGRAYVVQEPMARSPSFAAVAIDVEEVEDQRLQGRAVTSGIGLDWTSEGMRRFLSADADALREIAAGESWPPAGARDLLRHRGLSLLLPPEPRGRGQEANLTGCQRDEPSDREKGELTMTETTQ